MKPYALAGIMAAAMAFTLFAGASDLAKARNDYVSAIASTADPRFSSEDAILFLVAWERTLGTRNESPPTSEPDRMQAFAESMVAGSTRFRQAADECGEDFVCWTLGINAGCKHLRTALGFVKQSTLNGMVDVRAMMAEAIRRCALAVDTMTDKDVDQTQSHLSRMNALLLDVDSRLDAATSQLRTSNVDVTQVAPIPKTASRTPKAIFAGRDTRLGYDMKIEDRNGTYYMDGSRMERARHENMPKGGLSLAMTDRIGDPDMYYVVKPKMVDIYVNCEFGPCEFKRSIIGTCCTADRLP